MNFFVLQDGLKIDTFPQAYSCFFGSFQCSSPWINLCFNGLIIGTFGALFYYLFVLFFSFAPTNNPIPLSSMFTVSHFYSPINFVSIYLNALVMLTLISISEIHYKSIFWHYSYCCSYHQSGQLFSRHFLLHLPQSLPI